MLCKYNLPVFIDRGWIGIKLCHQSLFELKICRNLSGNFRKFPEISATTYFSGNFLVHLLFRKFYNPGCNVAQHQRYGSYSFSRQTARGIDNDRERNALNDRIATDDEALTYSPFAHVARIHVIQDPVAAAAATERLSCSAVPVPVVTFDGGLAPDEDPELGAGPFFAARPGPPRAIPCLQPAAGSPRPADGFFRPAKARSQQNLFWARSRFSSPYDHYRCSQCF